MICPAIMEAQTGQNLLILLMFEYLILVYKMPIFCVEYLKTISVQMVKSNFLQVFNSQELV